MTKKPKSTGAAVPQSPAAKPATAAKSPPLHAPGGLVQTGSYVKPGPYKRR